MDYDNLQYIEKPKPQLIINQQWLVGGLNPSEKYEFVSWDYDIPI